ncbi:unnamed protein product [Lymnaea stagnalis]|uniref:Cytochrome b-c1 complex subunit 10 n=1 Tax=Lymnaea stagnalis TaxID=6523 RepID=A0AAV2H092_LYMST
MTTMAGAQDITLIKKLFTRLTKNWGPSVAVYAATLTVVGIYITDWKVVATKIPFYGKKFEEESNI